MSAVRLRLAVRFLRGRLPGTCHPQPRELQMMPCSPSRTDTLAGEAEVAAAFGVARGDRPQRGAA